MAQTRTAGREHAERPRRNGRDPIDRLRRGRGLIALAGGGSVALAVVTLLAIPSLGASHPGVLTSLATPSGGGGHHLVTANFSGNFTITKSSVVNNVTSLVVTTVRTLTGNMSGVLVAYEWGVIQANGSMWVSGTGTFVGTILGGSPGLVTIWWQHATGTFGVSVAGTVHVTNGEKGLTGVHGGGAATVSFTGGSGFAGSYALQLDLD